MMNTQGLEMRGSYSFCWYW